MDECLFTQVRSQFEKVLPLKTIRILGYYMVHTEKSSIALQFATYFKLMQLRIEDQNLQAYYFR